MANRQLSPVSYRRFQAQPLLSEGLLAVERQGGDLERKVAMGLARMADEFGARADKQAQRAGERAGARDALAGAPTGARVTRGGQPTVSSDGKGGYRVYTGSAIDQAKALLRDEEGFRETPYWDVNAHRVGYGSDTATLADGRTVKVSQGMKVSRDDAERDLDYRLSAREGAQVRRQLGGVFEKLPANVQAALYSVGYNYGSLPGPVVAAGRSGDLGAIADAVAGLSSNPDRRRREAAIIRGGGSSSYVDPMVSAPGAAGATTAPAGFSPASVAPISVTPGQAGSWRPSGRDTIRGRAYDVAGTRTYLEMADLAMVENQQAIFEQYRDDPVMLEKALGEGLEAELRDNVLEEIAPEFEVAYRKRASSILSKARAEQQEKLQQQNRVEFLGRVEELENRKSQQMAGLDPNDDGAAGDLADLQSSIDAHWDSAVARGVVDLDDAEKFKRSSRSDTTVGFYVRQASKMGADDIRTMRADMTRDYAEGALDGVTADDWAKIEQGLAAAESARRTQDVKADADLTKRGEDLAKRVARGLPVTPEEVARFQLDAGTAPRGKEIVGSTLTRMRVSEAIRTMPIGAVEKNVSKLLGEGATAEDIDFARKTIAEHRRDLDTDPLGVAERFGVLPVSEGLPLDGEIDPSSVSAAFSERLNAAKAAADHFGTSPKFFRPGEAAQIEAAVKADPQRGLDIAAGLVDAAGPDADRVLRELGDVAPAVSLSGSLIAAGGNRQAAVDLIAGYGKNPEGKDYADVPNTKRLPAARDISGGALSFTPAEVNRLDQAAAAIARKRLYDAGVDPKKDDAKEVYEKAYQEAAGASFSGGVQFGGFADYDRGWRYSPKKVLLPPSVRADKFGDLLGALTDADLGGVTAKNGKTWTAGDFQRAMPVAVKGGFAFALGDPEGSSPMFIADENGAAVVLDLETMRPALEPRVPGAYR